MDRRSAGPAWPVYADLQRSRFHWNLGDVLVLLCAICFAMHIALTGRYAKLHDTIALVTMQFAVVGVLALFSSLLLEPIMLPTELFAAVLAPKV